jgi:hypothetical protein
MAQTGTYSFDRAVAVPGMTDDGPKEIDTFIAYEDLPFGRAVRLHTGTTDQVELPTDDSGAIVGFVVYKDMLEMAYPPAGAAVIKAGTPVAILRKGRMWAAWDGAGTVAVFTQFNIRNNAAAPTTKGMVTAAAASADVVRAGTRGTFYKARKDATLGIAQIEVSLP